MSSLRIRSTSAIAATTRAGPPSAVAADPPPNPIKEYLERLVKLIPAEVVGLYLAGKSLILTKYPIPLPTGAEGGRGHQIGYLLTWTIFCLLAIVAVRVWATRDPAQAKGPQWGAVAIATISFLIWVYSFGDIFAVLGIWEGLAAGLLVLAWTFIVPLVYRGDPVSPARNTRSPAPTPAAVGPAAGAFSGGGAELAALAATPPANFTQADAELAVIAGAKAEGVDISLSDTVSARFTNARQARKLLGKIQDFIDDTHGIWVVLSTVPEPKVVELMGKSYLNLAIWTRGMVIAGGWPTIEGGEDGQ